VTPQGLERLAQQLQQFKKDAQQGQQNLQDAQKLRRQAEEVLKNADPEERQMLDQLARDLAAQNRDRSTEPEQRPLQKPKAGTDEGQQPRTHGGEGQRPDEGSQASQAPAASPMLGPGGEPGSGPGIKNPHRGPVAQPTDVPTQPVDARGQAKPSPSEHVIADYFNDKVGGRGTFIGPTLQQGVHDAARGAEQAIEQQSVPSQYSDLVRRVFKRYVERVQPGAAEKGQPVEDAPDAQRPK
jgi:hypothetical protein